MFRFVVHRLRWLACIPGAPQFFDALLLAHTALFHRERLAAMEEIEAAALRLPGVRLRVHRLGGVEFFTGDRELGHLHGNGLLDVFAGRELAAALVNDGRAEWHHVFGPSAWVSCWVRGREDIAGATELLRAAFANGCESAAPRNPQSAAACRSA